MNYDFDGGTFEQDPDGEPLDEMTPEMLIEEAGTLALEGDFATGFQFAVSGARAAQDEGLDSETVAGALEIAAFCALEMGDEALSIEQIAGLRSRGFDDEANYHEARLRFYRWDFHGAKRLAGLVSSGGGSAAGASYLLAILAEYDGDYSLADQLFARAESLDPEGYPQPMRLTDGEIDETLRTVIESLPDELRDAIGNTMIEVVDLPDPIADASPDMHPQMLGMFQGHDLMSESVFDPGGLPPRARIFKRNLERVCSTREEAMEEITRTIYHEIGHRFGFDEEGLEGLDLD